MTNKYQKKYLAKYSEIIRKKRALYYEKNKEKLMAKRAEYYKNNKDKVYQYYQANKDKINARRRAYNHSTSSVHHSRKYNSKHNPYADNDNESQCFICSKPQSMFNYPLVSYKDELVCRRHINGLQFFQYRQDYLEYAIILLKKDEPINLISKTSPNKPIT